MKEASLSTNIRRKMYNMDIKFSGTVLYDGGVLIFKNSFEDFFDQFGTSAIPFSGYYILLMSSVSLDQSLNQTMISKPSLKKVLERGA